MRYTILPARMADDVFTTQIVCGDLATAVYYYQRIAWVIDYPGVRILRFGGVISLQAKSCEQVKALTEFVKATILDAPTP